MAQAMELRWGIISTGFIAAAFVKDLLVDPKTRNMDDIAHKVVAVGSRNQDKAREFVDKYFDRNSGVKAYGSYDEVYRDKASAFFHDVDIVYIGTPHTFHYPNALDAIKGGKHVLCEKPATLNATELRSLLTAAKERGVFFMEAMWTRFQPLIIDIKRIIDEGTLGLPVTLHADLSNDFDIYNIPKSHRILNPELGGGGLLDLGPYPLVWAIIAFYEHPKNNLAKPSNISGAMVKTLTNVDCNTSFTVTWASQNFSAQAVLSCSINAPSHETGVLIKFERGAIKIPSPAYCPHEFTVQYHDPKNVIVKEERKLYQYVGGGWYFQADEVARCIRDGRKQSSLWGHDKSLLEMEIFDEVRRQGNYPL